MAVKNPSIFHFVKGSPQLLLAFFTGLFLWLVGWRAQWAGCLSNPMFWLTGMVSVLVVVAVWRMNIWLIAWLDPRLNGHAPTWKRVAIQLGISLVASFLLIFVMVSLAAFFFPENTEGKGSFQLHLSTLLLLVLGANGMDFYQKTKAQSKADVPIATMPETPAIPIGSGRKQCLVRPDDIAYVLLTDTSTRVRLFDGTELPCDISLAEFQSKHLSPTDFYRANRRCIVHRRAVREYRKTTANHLELTLVPPVNLPIVVNKNGVRAFMDWLLA